MGDLRERLAAALAAPDRCAHAGHETCDQSTEGIPPAHSVPRVWSMPEPIPPTVDTVKDKHGRTFHRIDGHYWRRGPQEYQWREGDLILSLGPLTEATDG